MYVIIKLFRSEGKLKWLDSFREIFRHIAGKCFPSLSTSVAHVSEISRRQLKIIDVRRRHETNFVLRTHKY